MRAYHKVTDTVNWSLVLTLPGHTRTKICTNLHLHPNLVLRHFAITRLASLHCILICALFLFLTSFGWFFEFMKFIISYGNIIFTLGLFRLRLLLQERN